MPIYETSIFDMTAPNRAMAIATAIRVVADSPQLSDLPEPLADSLRVLLDVAAHEAISLAKVSRKEGGIKTMTDQTQGDQEMNEEKNGKSDVANAKAGKEWDACAPGTAAWACEAEKGTEDVTWSDLQDAAWGTKAGAGAWAKAREEETRIRKENAKARRNAAWACEAARAPLAAQAAALDKGRITRTPKPQGRSRE